MRLFLVVALFCRVFGESTETSESVLAAAQRGLISEERSHADLHVLGFVTPWNGGGITTARDAAQRGRLDAVSAVTYVVRDGKVTGDAPFAKLSEVPDSASRRPRFMFEDTHWVHDVDAAARAVADACEDIGADGAVIEAWHACGGDLRALLNLGRTVRALVGHSALAVPPLKEGMDVAVFADAFDHLIVMTYDYSRPGGEPGPVAPLGWVRQVADFWCSKLGAKALLGLNFYGIDFASRSGTERGTRSPTGEDRHVTGNDVLDLLRKHQPHLVYQKPDDVAEHVFEYNEGGERLVYYPSASSLRARVALANELGCGGVAVWELGQGLAHFLDAV